MKKIGILLVVLVALLVSGGLFLLTWDVSPPTQRVEKVLPDNQFPR
jgi:hypothetical protein